MTDIVNIESRAPLGNEDLDRLEELLGQYENSMMLDELHGFLCAIHTGPEIPEQAEWLKEVFGGEEPGQETAELVLRMHRNIIDILDADEIPSFLLYDEEEGESPDLGHAWSNAYLYGIDCQPVDWFEESGVSEEETEYLDELLFPIIVLSGQAEEAAKEHGETWPEGEESQKLKQECLETLPFTMLELFRFWKIKRSKPAPVRKQAKPGRNDPCTCGSGKKFKQCCETNDEA